MTALAPYGSGVRMSTPPSIWLKSEWLNSDAFLRFAPPVAEYDSANWPFGISLTAPANSDVGLVNVVDGRFDWHVKCAWALPRRYSGLSAEVPDRRERANVIVRNVGHWNGDPARYDGIISSLAHRRLRGPSDDHMGYALTPFGIIAQTWTQSEGFPPGAIRNTYIAFFYSYESFIQECLALDARRKGASADEIMKAYEHVYSNASPLPDALPHDPRVLKLARFANPGVSWDEIRMTAEVLAGHDGVLRYPTSATRSRRETLFFCRLQTHLMVALAAASHGIASFLSGAASSPLVRPMASPPDMHEMAAPWLGHVLGHYEHAAECAALLQGLARHYGRELSESLRGLPIPAFPPLRSAAEEIIVYAVPPMFGGRDEPDGSDMFRWCLFDTSLDDVSVRRWSEDAHRWVHEAER
jgi:hypothetical protein